MIEEELDTVVARQYNSTLQAELGQNEDNTRAYVPGLFISLDKGSVV